MLDLIGAALRREPALSGFVRLDGAMSAEQRQAALHKFREDPKVKVLLLSLRAGGVGLNLTAAQHVFLMDPWWNPAVEEQAIDRVHRIGQLHPVKVTRFVVRGTVEERICETPSGVHFIDTPGIKIPLLTEAKADGGFFPSVKFARDLWTWRAMLKDLDGRLLSQQAATRPLALVYVHRASMRVIPERIEELITRSHRRLVPTFLLCTDVCAVDDAALADKILGEGEHTVVRQVSGSELLGKTYEPIFNYATPEGGRYHEVIEADFVTASSGTGVVHMAPAFGEDDQKAAKKRPR